MKPVKIGLLGLGTVGRGTREVLSRNREEISRRAGRDISITRAAVRNLDRSDVTDIALTADPYQVVNDPEIEVIAELIGGY